MGESTSPARLEQLAHRLEEAVDKLRGVPVGVELLDDGELVQQRIAEAVRSAHELRAMHPVGSSEKGREEQKSRRSVLDALQHGMAMRTIVHASVLDDPRKRPESGNCTPRVTSTASSTSRFSNCSSSTAPWRSSGRLPSRTRRAH
ncbi:hypothetical protein [Microtetraspora malaysiensis]|uniref:hypothetical protein n=1 Tax=Microtetraspora malaysiensis TaxID=161358 RepID=UPI000AF48EE3|nr:hypothetical protein [Microtetraspora malaysiensis]